MVESLRRQLASVENFVSITYLHYEVGGGAGKGLNPSTFPNAAVVGDLEAIRRKKIYAGVGGAAHLSRQETT